MGRPLLSLLAFLVMEIIGISPLLVRSAKSLPQQRLLSAPQPPISPPASPRPPPPSSPHSQPPPSTSESQRQPGSSLQPSNSEIPPPPSPSRPTRPNSSSGHSNSVHPPPCPLPPHKPCTTKSPDCQRNKGCQCGPYCSNNHTRGPPRKINTGKKIGVLFAGIAGILQVAVVGFLVFKRWQISKMKHKYGVCS
uniref:Uncharacterized protein n=1 Tax=Nelumbo nucifera TaxID=4432 RepID=A0A823A0J5_NELNU|nr:TPA_asm: hypothetical protein HUJ06_019032 [Nelumbo nucifera]